MLSVPDGRTVASSSQDYTIKLWNINSGKYFKIFRGHTSSICSITFCPDNQTLISSSEDETIRIWDLNTSECIKILRGEKLYEGMNLKEATGLTEATFVTLKTLGATIR